mmetsp:Transcript_41230/g.124645  ORF Transcript_41230/g.124645 Transcript_41230/m.124645 type:complete len:337 (+) Transcript_41230:1003-2013(+)
MLGPDESVGSALFGGECGTFAQSRIGQIDDGLQEYDGVGNVFPYRANGLIVKGYRVIVHEIDGRARQRIASEVFGTPEDGSGPVLVHVPHPVLSPYARVRAGVAVGILRPRRHPVGVERPFPSPHHETPKVIHLARASRRQSNGRPRVDPPSDQELIPGNVAGVAYSHVSDARFVQYVESHDVRFVLHGRGDLLEHGAERVLKIILGGTIVDRGLGGEIVPRKKERPHRPRGASHIVRIPRHARNALPSPLLGMYASIREGRPRSLQRLQIEPRLYQSPRGGAAPSRESRPRILMTVQEYRQSVLPAFFYQRDEVRQIVLVVYAGTLVFDRLPRVQ